MKNHYRIDKLSARFW